jgi:hydroxymethylbilane synthase
MRSARRIVIGTRGSDLARAQTSLVEQGLRRLHPELEIVIEIIRTSGDERKGSETPAPVRSDAGRKGMFTAEIERVLLDGRIDVAVHSAKDLPSEPTAGLELCATLPRAPVEDVLVLKGSRDLSTFPPQAIVATGSVRRQHQLRAVRPDLTLVDLRGNVPTRLRKLLENSWDAIVLARAGLERLGYNCEGHEIVFEGQTLRVFPLSTDNFLTAGGQGIVALQVRADDGETRGLLAGLDHAETMLCLRAEREFLRLLQGDCGTPVGVLATIESEQMTMRAQLFDETRADPRSATLHRDTRLSQPETIAAELLELMNG